MEYNGYHAKVEYDGQDDIFVGTVIGLNGMLGFHGASVDELILSFKTCIDNYQMGCKEAGKQPEKGFRGMFNLRIPPESHRKAALEQFMEPVRRRGDR